MAADDHLHPRDLLPTGRSVVVFFIPFKKELVRENQPGDRPCRNWGLAYVQTNDLIDRLSRALGEHLQERGFRAGLTPATHNFDEEKLMARWSHKHLGHLCRPGPLRRPLHADHPGRVRRAPRQPRHRSRAAATTR